ncbi:TPA: hypothetical protein ACT9LI_002284 [Legionella pneumophila]
MNPQQLKKAIVEDIRIIKGLEPEIIPAWFYYGNLLKMIFSGFWKIFLILFIAFCINELSATKVSNAWPRMITDSIMVSFFLSAVGMLILLAPISFFVQFRFHLEGILKTGSFIRKKCNHISMVFFGVFASLCILSSIYISEIMIVFGLIVSFFLSIGATQLVVNMELSRIGFSSLFTLCNEFFSKGKIVSIEAIQK